MRRSLIIDEQKARVHRLHEKKTVSQVLMAMKKKKKTFLRRMRRQLGIVVYAIAAVLVFLIGVIIYINIKNGDKYSQVVLNQKKYESLIVPYKRGDILDRNGTVLATSDKVYNLILEPKHILNATEDKKKVTFATLKKYFHLTDEDMEKLLSNQNSMYKIAVKGLTYSDVKDFKDFMDTANDKKSEAKLVVGTWLEESYVRKYPYNSIGCHLLGYTIGGNSGTGGLEGYYNDTLNGENGRTYSYLNDDYNLEKKTEPAVDGSSLVTTIDLEIQKIAQHQAEEYMKEIKAKNISVMVMDPRDSSILALYNTHQYNPNEPYDYSTTKYQFVNEYGTTTTVERQVMNPYTGMEETIQEETATITDAQFDEVLNTLTDEEKVEALENVWRNFAVSDFYEPGSTFKPVTIAGALEDGIVEPTDMYFCGGALQVADYNIACHNTSGHGQLDVSTGLAKSCNVVLMGVAAKMGRSAFYKYEKMFGFGQRTNIDLSGEPAGAIMEGMIYNEDSLNSVELATSSFGQGINVTMVQLCNSFCAIVNGGDYHEPYVVKQIVDSDGNVIRNHENKLVRKAVSKRTAEEVKLMLKQVVEAGTGTKAAVEGYSIGGKTGTAEKLPRNNGKYILSFIGCAPLEDPEVVIYCLVDEPGVPNATATSAGSVLFNMVAKELLPYLNIYRSGDYEEPTETEDESFEEGVFMQSEEENPEETLISSYTDGNGCEVRVTQDAYGNITTRVKDLNGNVTVTVTDAWGNVISTGTETDADFDWN